MLEAVGAAGIGGSVKVTDPEGRELQPLRVITKFVYTPAVRPDMVRVPVPDDKMDDVGCAIEFLR